MKTTEGWLRGRQCGKEYLKAGNYVCAFCDRRGETKADLCYPIRLGSPPAQVSRANREVA